LREASFDRRSSVTIAISNLKDDMNPVICSIARTPIGRFGATYPTLSAMDLGGAAISATLERAELDPADVDEVIFGHVLQAGQGQITSRQAAVNGGIPMSVPTMTINKVCLSGMTSIALAADHIRLSESQFVVAGGMESMTNAPYVLEKARAGYKYGDGILIDSLTHDGLFCAFDSCLMGESSDLKNADLHITREDQDAWSARSHERAAIATDSGIFAEEIVPVSITQRRGDPVIVSEDQGIRRDTTPESLSGLRSAFTKGGSITAGNASQISDGAAALVIADRGAAEAAGMPILAEILSYAQVAGPDATLHERPAEALQMALDKASLSTDDLDLVEINEAFASVAMWSTHMLGIDDGRVNIHGGAVALGHPLGATGARIVVTLINALEATGGTIGGAALCGGGGQGDALIIRMA
jgi:acetyl-CoA C-acetyltransferase